MPAPSTINHYENFPVASVLLPASLRPAVASIYHFARTADDIADEGDALPEERLKGLTLFERQLDCIECGQTVTVPLFQSLSTTVSRHHLPLSPFRNLLSAFKQDVYITRYQTFDALLDYCSRSADPVGRLMLHLYGAISPENEKQSDAICSALQLINFLQDIAIDNQKNRIYIPLEDLTRFNITESQIADQHINQAWVDMMRFQTQRARSLMMKGCPLAKRLPGRIGWELRLVIQGGLRILELIDQVNGDVFRHRPHLSKRDWCILCWRAIFS